MAPKAPDGLISAYRNKKLGEADLAKLVTFVVNGELEVPEDVRAEMLAPLQGLTGPNGEAPVGKASLELSPSASSAPGAQVLTQQPASGDVVDPETLAAYRAYRSTPEQNKNLEYLLEKKRLKLPDGQTLRGPIVDKSKHGWWSLQAGAGQMTPEVAGLPDWRDMQELNTISSLKSLKTRVALMGASKDRKDDDGLPEAYAILKKQYPEVWESRRVDENGNLIFKSGNGKEYAVKPGTQPVDVDEFFAPIALTAAASPAVGGIGGALLAVGAGGAAAAGKEQLQESSGGTFDPMQVVVGAGSGLAGYGLGKGLAKGISALARIGKPKNVQQLNKLVDGVIQDLGATRDISALNASVQKDIRGLIEQADQALLNRGRMTYSELDEVTKGRNALLGRMKDLFGEKLEKGLLDQIKKGTSSLSKGETAAFDSLLDSVPARHRPTIAATALQQAMENSERAGEVTIDSFHNFWRVLKQNSGSRQALLRHLPDGAESKLDDLAKLSEVLAKNQGGDKATRLAAALSQAGGFTPGSAGLMTRAMGGALRFFGAKNQEQKAMGEIVLHPAFRALFSKNKQQVKTATKALAATPQFKGLVDSMQGAEAPIGSPEDFLKDVLKRSGIE